MLQGYMLSSELIELSTKGHVLYCMQYRSEDNATTNKKEIEYSSHKASLDTLTCKDINLGNVIGGHGLFSKGSWMEL